MICCEHEHDADRVRKALRKRLERFGLRLNNEKTRMVSFARPSAGRNGGTSFDFLGFTFYWGRSLNGHPIPKVKTSGKRLRASLARVREWASTCNVHHTSHPHPVQMVEPPPSTSVLYVGEIPAFHGPASVTAASRLYVFV